jgi:hypothetical protein
MNIEPNDKVICINDSPLPVNFPDQYELENFHFPYGFIEGGQIYCVTATAPRGLFLAGISVHYDGIEFPWNELRFRKIHARSECQTHIQQAELLSEA